MDAAILRAVTRRFGENVTTVMNRLGINRSQLADKMGKPKGQVSDWLNEEWPNISLENLLLFAKALGVPMDALLVGIDADYDKVIASLPTIDRLRVLWPELSPTRRRSLLDSAWTTLHPDDPLPEPDAPESSRS